MLTNGCWKPAQTTGFPVSGMSTCIHDMYFLQTLTQRQIFCWCCGRIVLVNVPHAGYRDITFPVSHTDFGETNKHPHTNTVRKTNIFINSWEVLCRSNHHPFSVRQETTIYSVKKSVHEILSHQRDTHSVKSERSYNSSSTTPETDTGLKAYYNHFPAMSQTDTKTC